MILRRMFEGKEGGFYVDVGAHHPRRFSNTYFFYRRGWSGINIEPNPDAAGMFRAERRNDINVQLAVADRAESLTYYVFDEPAVNTFDRELANSRVANTSCKLLRTVDVPVKRLDEILQRYLPADQKIDFMSIDVEGLDLAVLRSNDWQTFRPKCVLVEVLGRSLEDALNSDVYRFMKGHGYELFAKTFNTLVFRREVKQSDSASGSAKR